jgi:hypothetical protein
VCEHNWQILVPGAAGRKFTRQSGIPRLINWFLWVEPEECTIILRILYACPAPRIIRCRRIRLKDIFESL